MKIEPRTPKIIPAEPGPNPERLRTVSLIGRVFQKKIPSKTAQWIRFYANSKCKDELFEITNLIPNDNIFFLNN